MARYSIKRGGYVTLRRGRYYRGRRIGAFLPGARLATTRRRTRYSTRYGRRPRRNYAHFYSRSLGLY